MYVTKQNNHQHLYTPINLYTNQHYWYELLIGLSSNKHDCGGWGRSNKYQNPQIIEYRWIATPVICFVSHHPWCRVEIFYIPVAHSWGNWNNLQLSQQPKQKSSGIFRKCRELAIMTPKTEIFWSFEQLPPANYISFKPWQTYWEFCHSAQRWVCVSFGN